MQFFAGLRRGASAIREAGGGGGGGGGEGEGLGCVDSLMIDRMSGCAGIEGNSGDVVLKEEDVFESTVK
jgi:hypothetical protein